MAIQEYKIKARMQHTDAGGVVFYANLFVMAHECYEAMLEKAIDLPALMEQIQIPIAHAEADYKLPLRLWEDIAVELQLLDKKRTSFTLQYTFKKKDGQCAATVQTVHVCIDLGTRKPIKIPAAVQTALGQL